MTTICLQASSERLTLYFYGELPQEERRAFEQHLATCERCGSALAELELLGVALSDRAAAGRVRTPEEWDGFMRRLMPHLEATDRPARPARGISLSRAPLYALAAMLLLAIGAGLVWQRRVLGPSSVPAADAGAGDATLAAAAAQHFDRAKLVVIGIAMKDPAQTHAADWERERQLAASLLPETRLFRLSATDRGDARLARLLGDLETVLLQAAMATEADAPDLERLQRAIRRRDLLVRMDLREL